MSLIAFSTGDYENPGFLEKVKKIVFPDLEEEHLQFPHARFIQNALITAQTYVECLRTNNVDFYDKDDFSVGCNVASFEGPSKSRIQAVYAFKPGVNCKRRHYDQKSVQAIMCYVDDIGACKCRNEEDLCQQILTGTAFCEQELGDSENTFICADRFFAKGGSDKLFLAPVPHCDYRVAVHWEGIKYAYADADLIADDEDLIDLISTSLRGERALYIDRDIALYREILRQPDVKKADAGGTFWQKLDRMAHRCREERRLRKMNTCEAIFDDSALSRGFDPLPVLDCTEDTVLTFSPAAETTLNVPSSVSISAASGNAKIYYTLDGSEPTAESTLYTGAILLDDADAVLKAIAVSGTCTGEVYEAEYVLMGETACFCLTFRDNKIVDPATSVPIKFMDELVSVEDNSLTEIGNPAAGARATVQFNEDDRLESIALNALTKVDHGFLEVDNNGVLESVTCPVMTGILATGGVGFDARVRITDCASLDTVGMPELTTVGDACELDISRNLLPNLDLSSLATLGDAAQLQIQSNTALVAPLLGAFSVTGSSATIQFDGCALDETTVDFILARCVASAGFVSGTVDLSGGTNAAPSVAGAADAATLTGRGVLVSTN